MKRKISGIITGFILLALCVFPNLSYATIFLAGNGTWGDFEGSLSYGNATYSSATLEISLKNVSPIANGGFLTGFAFNNPPDSISGVTNSFSNSNFQLLGPIDFDNEINAMPYGYFDVGAGLGGSFEGGGTPSDGIAVGQTETFTFYLTGTGLNGLNESSFLNAMPVLPNGSTGSEFFIVRFKAFNNGQSDKTPGDTVPEPASLSLLGLGLLGLAGFQRKKG